MPGPPATVLCVCTGNVCRSPTMGILLASALGPTVTVGSAGTAALVGRGIAGPTAALLTAHGVDPTGFTARQLERPLLAAADLVLTATREQRARSVAEHPASVRRTFTLKEFARLLGSVDVGELDQGGPSERIRAAVALAGRRRSFAAAYDDDLADPYAGPAELHAEVFAEIVSAVQTITGRLGLRPAFFRAGELPDTLTGIGGRGHCGHSHTFVSTLEVRHG